MDDFFEFFLYRKSLKFSSYQTFSWEYIRKHFQTLKKNSPIQTSVIPERINKGRNSFERCRAFASYWRTRQERTQNNGRFQGRHQFSPKNRSRSRTRDDYRFSGCCCRRERTSVELGGWIRENNNNNNKQETNTKHRHKYITKALYYLQLQDLQESSIHAPTFRGAKRDGDRHHGGSNDSDNGFVVKGGPWEQQSPKSAPNTASVEDFPNFGGHDMTQPPMSTPDGPWGKR